MHSLVKPGSATAGTPVTMRSFYGAHVTEREP